MTTIFSQSNIRTEIREFLRIAVPLASAQVAQSLIGFVDTVMMGRLGQESLAAGGLASITFFALLSIASGIVMGVSTLVAEAYGAGNKTRIEQVTSQGLWLSLVLTIPIMLFVLHIGTFMHYLGQNVTTISLAKSYLDVIVWGFFPALAFAMLRGVVSGLSQARPVMVIVIAGTLLNVVGNYILAYGKLGFPKMGLVGLALASALTTWTMFIALVVYILRHKQLKTYKLFQNLNRLKLQILQELMVIGVPIGMSSALEIGLFTVVTYLMGILGTDVLAAHQIVFQTMFVIFMVPLGMSYAITARIGQWSGQQNIEGVRRAGQISTFIVIGFMTLMTFVLLIFSQQVIGLYIDIRNPENANIIALATSMLNIAALAHPVDGLQKVMMGALYGLQDTIIPVLLSLLAFWGIGLTSGYLLGFHFGLGGTGLWIGQSIGVAISAGLFVWRFRKLVSLGYQVKLK